MHKGRINELTQVGGVQGPRPNEAKSGTETETDARGEHLDSSLKVHACLNVCGKYGAG